jgi:hypothetical protein
MTYTSVIFVGTADGREGEAMAEPTIETMNREVAERLGIEWNEPTEWDCECAACKALISSMNPDFTTPVGRIQLLELMMKDKRCEVFLTKIALNGYELANLITDNTGKLLKAVWEWKERHE